MKLSVNSVIRYTNPRMETSYGVIISYGQTYDGKPEVFATVYFGGSYLELSVGLLTPVTNAYVGIGMGILEVYNDFKSQFNTNLENIEKEVNSRVFEFARNIKPSLRKKDFHFKSIYTPEGFIIKVIKTADKPHGVITINDQVLNKKELQTLNDIVNQTIAGMQVANTTIKIGDIIGDTDTIRKALEFYYS